MTPEYNLRWYFYNYTGIMFLHVRTRHAKVSQYQSFSDEALISCYRKTKDTKLIAELFERYTHLVYGICLKYLHNRELCKDAVMEIFESLFEKLLKYEIGNYKNWLYSVSRNYCLDMLRKNIVFDRIRHKLQDEMRQELQEQLPDKLFLTIEECKSLSNDQTLLHAVEQLNTGQHKCLRMLYLESKSYQDISNITGYTLKQVKSHVQNGKRNLKNHLMRKYDRK